VKSVGLSRKLAETVHKTARNGGFFFFAAAIKMFVRKAISTQADKSPPTERKQPTFEKERPN
jgi:hypothetical protein